MKNLSTKVCTLLFSLLSAIALACPDSKYEEKLIELKALAPAVLVEEPTAESLVQFFKAMPSSFSCFNRLFGYSINAAPLYSEPQLHFLFPKIQSAAPKHEFTAKLVSLAVNARWEADQTGALQDAVRNSLDDDTLLFVQIMEGYDKKQQESVWAFLFGGPHPSNIPISNKVQKKICESSDFNCTMSKDVYAAEVAKEHTH